MLCKSATIISSLEYIHVSIKEAYVFLGLLIGWCKTCKKDFFFLNLGRYVYERRKTFKNKLKMTSWWVAFKKFFVQLSKKNIAFFNLLFYCVHLLLENRFSSHFSCLSRERKYQTLGDVLQPCSNQYPALVQISPWRRCINIARIAWRLQQAIHYTEVYTNTH